MTGEQNSVFMLSHSRLPPRESSAGTRDESTVEAKESNASAVV